MTRDKIDSLRSGSWLPEKKLRESIRAGTFFATVAALIVTSMFVYLDFGNPNALTEIGSVFTSIVLGFCINNCWREWEKGDLKRAKAIDIDKRVDEEIRKVSEDLQQQLSALRILPEERSAESRKMVVYFLSQRKIYVRGYVHKMADDIRGRGYDYQAFLEEKRIRFNEIQMLADSLIGEIYSSAAANEIEELKQLIGSLDEGIQLDTSRSLIDGPKDFRSSDTEDPEE